MPSGGDAIAAKSLVARLVIFTTVLYESFTQETAEWPVGTA